MIRRAALLTFVCLTAAGPAAAAAGDAALCTQPYDRFESPSICADCHVDFARQWEQAMMSQAYTHHWDEIEYFELAVPHAEKDAKVAGVRAGCNGCHAPLAFLAGDVPPPRPEAGSRANESVSCDLCHTITGFEGDTPYNFNWTVSPGDTKVGPGRGGESPYHGIAKSAFLGTSEFCGTCHNEKSPYDQWVKSTHLEWREGPYAAEGVRCQDCHMPMAMGTAAVDGDARLVAQHLFHGAHDAGKLAGAVELRMHPDRRAQRRGGVVRLSVQLFNAKAGHQIPTGSVEDRIVWLHVEATDAAGKVYTLPVDPKGFDGEETTIAADVLAYQDMGIAKGIADFAGVQRDGVPVGDRIFRKAYFDPQGRMTMQQWNTASFGPDYRLGPRETKIETFTWRLPEDIAAGPVTVRAVLNYQKLVTPVGEFLKVPSEEMATIVINRAKTGFEVQG